MKTDGKFILRLYLTFSIFILISVVLLFNADISLIARLLGLAFVVVPVFVLLKAFEDTYNFLLMLTSVDIMEYEMPHRFSLKFFGLLPVFELLEKLNLRVKTINLENQLLYDTNLAIHTSTSLKQLLDTVVARLTTHSGADFGVVFLLDKEHYNDELRLVSCFNLTEADVVKRFFRVGEGIVGWAAKEVEAVLSQDVEKDRRYILCVYNTKSQMTLPIQTGSKIMGVILLGSYEVQRFKTKDLTLLKSIAGEIGLAVSNTWLTQKLKEEKERVALLYETAQQLAKRINLDDVAEIGVNTIYDSVAVTSCSLMLFDEDDEILKTVKATSLSEDTEKAVKLRVEEGIAGRAFQEGETLLIEDVTDEPQFKYLYCVPLRTQDCCIGSINVTTDTLLAGDKCKIVEAISSQVSVAVGNALLYESIEKLAIQDGLTGLYNYRYFQQALAKEFERARRYERDLSLVIIDIDDFKKYNDNYGHITGDYLLSEIGNIIQDSLRVSDILARYGGDELAVILPETNAEAALNLTERIKNKIDEYKFEMQDFEVAASDEEFEVKPSTVKEKLLRWLTDKGIISKNSGGLPTIHITISAGICSLSDSTGDKEQLINRADKALLRAKRMGKNKICLWNNGSTS